MRYNEYPVSKSLSRWLSCIWVFEHHGAVETEDTIVADGLPELIVHLESPCREQSADGSFIVQPEAVFSGQITKPLVLETPACSKMVGMRFLPGGLTQFVSQPTHVLTNVRLSARDVVPGVDRLVSQLKETNDDPQIVSVCSRFLQKAMNGVTSNNAVDFAIESIAKNKGVVLIESLAQEINMSRRNLELAFRNIVGISPKQFCRVIRFRHVFDLLTESESRSWVDIASRAGFFDQPHLIRDFRQFAGASPEAFLQTQSPLGHSILESS